MRVCCLCRNKKSSVCSFFRVPSEKVRRDRWKIMCEFDFKEKMIVCEFHFQPTDFINSEKYPNRGKRLQPGAVPSIGLKVTKEDPPSGEDFQPVEIKSDPLALAFDESGLESTSRGEPMDHKRTTCNQSSQTDDEFIHAKAIVEVIDLRRHIKKMEAEMHKLHEEMDKACAMYSRLGKIFTANQIKKLQNPNKLVAWDSEDIKNAKRLRDKSTRAYKYLYELGYPLPHMATIRHRTKSKNKENVISSDTEDEILPMDDEILTEEDENETDNDTTSTM